VLLLDETTHALPRPLPRPLAARWLTPWLLTVLDPRSWLVSDRDMSAARDWFDALDADLRALVLQVIASHGDPTDEQIEEAPDLIAKSWSLDAIRIPADKRLVLKTAIGELADKLRPTGARTAKRAPRRR